MIFMFHSETTKHLTLNLLKINPTKFSLQKETKEIEIFLGYFHVQTNNGFDKFSLQKGKSLCIDYRPLPHRSKRSYNKIFLMV